MSPKDSASQIRMIRYPDASNKQQKVKQVEIDCEGNGEHSVADNQQTVINHTGPGLVTARVFEPKL